MKYLSLVILTGLLSMSISVSAPAVINVIPQPRDVKVHPGHIRLDGKSVVVLPENVSESELLCSTQIQEKTEKISGIKIPVSISNKEQERKGIEILLGIPEKTPLLQKELSKRNLSLTPELGDEGYLLNIDDKAILIAAPTEKGVFYGTQSLLQLMEKNRKRVQLPKVTIRDYPLFKIRGISDDISRGQISTLDDFKNIVRNLSYFKINIYMPYIEDMFEFKEYPEIGIFRGRLTKEEARELVRYAQKYHVEIVPIFECLGHQDRILSIPRFNHLAETPDKPWCFAPVVEDTYPFLSNCIKELTDVYPSKYFCIGCDETYDLGRGKSKELADKIGKDGVFAQHILRVKEILDKLGKQTWMYADMPFSREYPDLKEKLPKDIVMVNWIYRIADDYDRAHAIANWGNPQIVSPAVHGWARLFPDFELANGNVDHLLNVGYKVKAIGEIQSSWCDFGGENYREFNWYSYAYSADAGWNPDHLKRDWFDDVYFKIFYGTDDIAVRKIHSRLVKTNEGFNHYRGTSALALWWDQIHEQTTRSIKYRSARSRILKNIAEDCEKLLPRAEKYVTEHRDHLELFKFVVERAKLLSLRLLIPEKKAEMIAAVNNPHASSKEKEDAVEKYVLFIKDQIYLLSELRPEFERLWLVYYKRPMLDDNLAKYDELNQYYDSLIAEAKSSLSAK